MEPLQPHPRPLRLFYFWVGIFATLCYRAIVVLNDISAVWVDIVWYIGTVGFILYFSHRFQISQKRARIIASQQLPEKVEKIAGFSDDDRAALLYVLHTLESSKEKWNYIVIFVTSGLALAFGIVTDLLM